MKRIIFISLLLITVTAASAQYEKEEKEKTGGFKKENLFTGGSILASFYTGGTSLGISPYFGYSINRFIDVAASFGFAYNSQRDYYVYGDKVKQTVIGPGVFARVYPVKFLFAQVQYEHNFTNNKYIAVQNNPYTLSNPKEDANSVLLGAGYSSGRQDVGDIYYYLSVSWDVTKLAGSPYIDELGRNYPIFKAGIQIPLFRGNGGDRDRGYHRRMRD